jgi:hypothetical protein
MMAAVELGEIFSTVALPGAMVNWTVTDCREVDAKVRLTRWALGSPKMDRSLKEATPRTVFSVVVPPSTMPATLLVALTVTVTSGP